MTFVSRLAVAAALAIAAPAGLMATSPAFAQALSPAVGGPLQKAQNLARAGNTSAAMAQVNAARGAAKTPAERQKVAQMAAFVHTRAGQYGAAARELESVGASARQLAPLYYQAGQYDKAIATARKAGGEDMQVLIAQSYIRTGKFDQAANTYNQLIKANGPKQKYLENLAAAQYKMGDKKAYLATTERLIRVDPSPERWKTLLLDLKGEQMPREAKLALFQLMRETNNITRPEDYQEFAKLAIVAGQPGVAKRALDDAQAAKVIATDDQMIAKLIDAAGKRAAQAQATVGKLPNTGAGLMTAGHTYMGMGDYAKAAAAYSKAIQMKAPNVDQARLLLGISQLRAGQIGAARSTFKAMPETSPYKDVASLWGLYASTKSA